MIKILEVSQVNRYIKELMSRDYLLNDLWVKGEISNFKYHSSGHMYFTLKDSLGIIKCVMFRANCLNLNFMPADGMKVIIRGSVSVYERDGQYQLYCEEMQPDGLGALYAAFEQLKRKLDEEGLFVPERKKKLPYFPSKIGVITSRTGAVIRDIINVSTRRFSNVQIVLFPVSVQGNSAAGEISHALEVFNRLEGIDVIILARGGGSLEELWAFNEEIVARAICKSGIPVVSAVGHETDYTIADMAADLRAPTPSAAAELIVPDAGDIAWKIRTSSGRMTAAVQSNLERKKMKLEKIVNSFMFRQPYDKIYQLRMTLDVNCRYLNKNIADIMKNNRQQLAALVSGLNALSPLAVLARGYSIAAKQESKEVIRSVSQICKDDRIDIKFGDGMAECRVEKTYEKQGE